MYVRRGQGVDKCSFSLQRDFRAQQGVKRKAKGFKKVAFGCSGKYISDGGV